MWSSQNTRQWVTSFCQIFLDLQLKETEELIKYDESQLKFSRKSLRWSKSQLDIYIGAKI